MVEANVGKFVLGRVIKQWDEGNAYRFVCFSLCLFVCLYSFLE
jgi:hypothetical protein